MSCSSESYDAIVIGAGFFGSYLALELGRTMSRVLLVEKESTILTRASYVNQARVHGGYHYPRSIVTGLRSRVNYDLFCREFEDCIDTSFRAYYAIASKFSNVSANQFRSFCERIDAPLRPAPKEISREFNSELIEQVFEVEECAFDAVKMRVRLLYELSQSNVKLLTGMTAQTVSQVDRKLEVSLQLNDSAAPSLKVSAPKVFICLYSEVNSILRNSSLPLIPLKHEYTEITLVEPPPFLANSGITVMCGPFFSIMPFPARKLHSFSHVRYTPHFSWQDIEQGPVSIGPLERPRETNFIRMQKDAARFMPCINECSYQDSIWETKTLLPRNEMDDSRPILFKQDHGLKGLNCIIGGKIDNVFDVLALMDHRAAA